MNIFIRIMRYVNIACEPKESCKNRTLKQTDLLYTCENKYV